MNLLTIQLPIRISFWKRKPVAIVVEDNAVDAELMSEALRAEGYDVEHVNSGEAALGLLKANGKRFVLMISDVRLPGITGWELRRTVTANYPTLPFAIATGESAQLAWQPAGEAVISIVKADNLQPAIRQIKKWVGR